MVRLFKSSKLHYYLVALGLAFVSTLILVLISLKTPSVVREIDGIMLGDSLSNILFHHPDLTLDKVNKPRLNDEVYYSNNSGSLILNFNNNKLTDIFHVCGLDERKIAVNLIHCGYTSSDVINIYSDAVEVYCLKNIGDPESYRKRFYLAPKYMVSYVLERNSVILIHATSNPFSLYDRLNDNYEKCGL